MICSTTSSYWYNEKHLKSVFTIDIQAAPEIGDIKLKLFIKIIFIYDDCIHNLFPL